MKSLPPNSINLILTDPPYNISNDNKIVRNSGKFGKAKPINLNFGKWDNNIIFPSDYLDTFHSLLKPNGVLIMFYDKLYLGLIGLYLQNTYDYQIRHLGNWIKTNPAPQARKVKWMNGSEQFIIATKNKGSGHHFNYTLGQSPDYYKASVSYKHLHPTQKPLGLIEWLISYWSYENDIVLDPFIGSGTTALACQNLNRYYIGYELDPQYYTIATHRTATPSINEWI